MMIIMCIAICMYVYFFITSLYILFLKGGKNITMIFSFFFLKYIFVCFNKYF